MSQTHRVAWGRFVHSLGWGNFGHPNTLWTAINTTHQPLQLNFFKLYHQLRNGSIHKQNNKREWLLQVACGKTCAPLGALLFTWQQNHRVVCTKSKDRHTVVRSCLFWSSVFAMICLLKNPNFRHFDDVISNLCILLLLFFFFLFFTSASSCLSSSHIPSSLSS